MGNYVMVICWIIPWEVLPALHCQIIMKINVQWYRNKVLGHKGCELKPSVSIYATVKQYR